MGSDELKAVGLGILVIVFILLAVFNRRMNREEKRLPDVAKGLGFSISQWGNYEKILQPERSTILKGYGLNPDYELIIGVFDDWLVALVPHKDSTLEGHLGRVTHSQLVIIFVDRGNLSLPFFQMLNHREARFRAANTINVADERYDPGVYTFAPLAGQVKSLVEQAKSKKDPKKILFSYHSIEAVGGRLIFWTSDHWPKMSNLNNFIQSARTPADLIRAAGQAKPSSS